VQVDRQANSTMVHELHHVAEVDQVLIPVDSIRRRIGGLSTQGIKLAAPVGAGIFTAGQLQRTCPESRDALNNTAGVFGAIAIGAHLLNPEERRARREEKRSSPQIITTTRREIAES